MSWTTLPNFDDCANTIIPSPNEKEKEKEEEPPNMPPKKRTSYPYTGYFNTFKPAFRPRVMHAENEEK